MIWHQRAPLTDFIEQDGASMQAVITDPQTKRRVRQAAKAEERAFSDGKAGEEWLDALAPLGSGADKAFLEVAPRLIAIFAQWRGGPHQGDGRKTIKSQGP